jgi:predicted HicB family RNase H-like nuclease
VIEYKGYYGLMDVNIEDRVISGRVLGIRDVVTFEGDTVAEAEQAFRDSVDDYLDFCAERGVSPDKPFSGKFVVRISPELHRALAVAAETHKVSLNALVEDVLSAFVSAKEGVRKSRGKSA